MNKKTTNFPHKIFNHKNYFFQKIIYLTLFVFTANLVSASEPFRNETNNFRFEDPCSDTLIIKIPKTICAGETFTFEVASESKNRIFWYKTEKDTQAFDTTGSGAKVNLSFKENTTYYLMPDTAGTGCTAKKQKVEFKVTAEPEKPNFSTNPEVCKDSTANLADFISDKKSEGKYTFFSDSKATKEIDSTQKAGTYYLVFTDKNSCKAETVKITLNEKTCIKEPEADLNLLKTVDRRVLFLGDTLTITTKITNSGPDNATNVQVKDSLSAALTFISATGDGAFTNNGKVTIIKFGEIPVNTTVEYQIKAKATAAGEESNNAEIIISDQIDPDSTPGNGFQKEDDEDRVSLIILDNCTEKKLPVPNIIVENKTICAGEKIKLTTEGCTNYVWSTGQIGATIDVSPQEDTEYVVYCYQDFCHGEASKTITIQVKALIAPELTATKTEICSGESVTITAEGCDETVIWSNGEKGNEIKIQPLETTSYSAICSSEACESAESETLTIEVNSDGLKKPTITPTLVNSCPLPYVNLNDAIEEKPKDSFLIFKDQDLVSAVKLDSLAYTSGFYYIYAANEEGCTSEAALLKVSILPCNGEKPTMTDLSLSLNTQKKDLTVGDTLNVKIIFGNNSNIQANGITLNYSSTEYLEIISDKNTIKGQSRSHFIDFMKANQKDSLSFLITSQTPGIHRLSTQIESLTPDSLLSNNTDVLYFKFKDTKPCLATSLEAKKERLASGFFDVKFNVYYLNCGKEELSSVNSRLDLSSLLNDTEDFELINVDLKGPDSKLVLNPKYDGIQAKNLFGEESKLPVGQTDTLTINYKINPEGLKSHYSFISEVLAQDSKNKIVGDSSNNGNIMIRSLVSPTELTFPADTALQSILNVKSVNLIEPGVNDITFEAVFKNQADTVLNLLSVNNPLSEFLRSPAKFSIRNIENSDGIQPNYTFDGRNSINLIKQGNLKPGTSDTLHYTIRLTQADTTVYFNQLTTTALLNGENILVKSNWSEQLAEKGNTPTRFEIDSLGLDARDDYSIKLAMAATQKEWLPDSSINITYTLILANLGKQQIYNIQLCDPISTDINADSAQVKLVKKPTLNPDSRLTLNPDFDGIQNHCILKPETSYLNRGATDTLTYTINLIPDRDKWIKSLTVTAQIDSSNHIGSTSNDGLNIWAAGSAPTIVILDPDFNNEMIGLAKKLISVNEIDAEEGIYDVSFRFTVKNYSEHILKNLQIEDDLNYVFSDTVNIQYVQFNEIPDGFYINPNFGQEKYLLLDNLSSISGFSTEIIEFTARIKINSKIIRTFENFGLVIGVLPNGEEMQDASTDGDEPDANTSGSPLDDSVPTLFEISSGPDITPLGVAKGGSAELTTSGSTRLIYTVIVKNYGQADLENVRLEDNLKQVYDRNTQFVVLSEPKVNEGSNLLANSNFDGNIDTRLLLEGSFLPTGVQDTLVFEVGVFNGNKESQTYKNQIVGTATYKGLEITDYSIAGDNPDADGDGDPGNDSSYTINIVDPGEITPNESLIKVSAGVSPNGDGFNDVFVIEDLNKVAKIDELGKLNVKIYNRWGSLVYKSDDYAEDYSRGNGWSGNSNTGVVLGSGKNLPNGTYYYIVSSSEKWVFDGKEKVGFVTLVN